MKIFINIAIMLFALIHICDASTPHPPNDVTLTVQSNDLAVLSFSSASNRHYIIQSSTDLYTWEEISFSPVVPDGDGMISRNTNTSAQKKFFRVSVLPWEVSDISNGFGDIVRSSLVIDNSGVIHVAFKDADNDDLIYATTSDLGQTWQRDVVSNLNNVGGYPTLRLSADDTPFIVYTDDSQNKIMCSWKPELSPTWLHATAADVDAFFVSWTKPSFSIAPDGTLGISYSDRNPYRLIMGLSSVQHPSSWTNITLIEDTINIGTGALEFDSSNNAIISFSQNGQAVVAQFDLSTLAQSNLLMSAGSTAYQINKSKTGRLLRSRVGSDVIILDISDDNGTTWTYRILDIGDTPYLPSVAFDANNEPSIACPYYTDVIFKSLNISNSYETVRLSSYGDFVDHDYLPDGRPVVIFRDGNNRLLCFIRD